MTDYFVKKVDVCLECNGLPDAMIFCGDCDGTGEIVSEVDLLKVLPELLDAVKTLERLAQILNAGAELER